MTSMQLSDAQENAIARKKRLALSDLSGRLAEHSAPINIALGGLVGIHLLGEDKSLATGSGNGLQYRCCAGSGAGKCVDAPDWSQVWLHDRHA